MILELVGGPKKKAWYTVPSKAEVSLSSSPPLSCFCQAFCVSDEKQNLTQDSWNVLELVEGDELSDRGYTNIIKL